MPSSADLMKDPFKYTTKDTQALMGYLKTTVSSVVNGLSEQVDSIMANPANYTSSGANGSNGSGPANVSGQNIPANKDEAVKFFESQGWTHAQAVGIVANLIKESGLKTDSVGDNGQAYGIAQWHPDRQARFKQQFGHDIRQGTFAEQLAFVDWELRNTHSNAGNKLRASTTPYDAAAAVCRYYEIPANVDERSAERGNFANSIA
jgi:hypothetical protein